MLAQFWLASLQEIGGIGEPSKSLGLINEVNRNSERLQSMPWDFLQVRCSVSDEAEDASLYMDQEGEVGAHAGD